MVDQTRGLVFDAESMQDPHGFYALVRDEGPVHKAVLPMGTEAWVVTRYAEARAALTDGRLSKDSKRSQALLNNQATNPQTVGDSGLAEHMLSSDPPDHTRLRKLVTKEFTARRIDGLRGRVQAISDALLDTIADGGTVDLLDVFGFPLPITVISELLGVPEEDRHSFHLWSSTMMSVGPRGAAMAAGRAVTEYLGRLISAKRAAPSDDLLSALVKATDGGERLSEFELTSMAFLLMVAGHETTANLIGNGLLALLRNPDQFAALRADRGLLPNAIEEFLRYDGPLNLATFRFTTEPIELGGVGIPADQFVMISLCAANRDPERYADPDQLGLTRESGHLAFGHGIHFCLGAPLARMEAEIAFNGLLDRFTDIELAVPFAELRWQPSTLMHGLTSLPVRLRPRSGADTASG
ncbi:MAG TPA: cytochrome P450 [Pseudonocardiaceae bacterium]|jgi:cytochrome P450|nr:cytochrome P450 [Pseudonocardiaceae bacterium]